MRLPPYVHKQHRLAAVPHKTPDSEIQLPAVGEVAESTTIEPEAQAHPVKRTGKKYLEHLIGSVCGASFSRRLLLNDAAGRSALHWLESGFYPRLFADAIRTCAL